MKSHSKDGRSESGAKDETDEYAPWDMGEADKTSDLSDLWDPELERFTLQKVIFKSGGTALASMLYYCEIDGPTHIRGDAMFLPAGSTVGFNTYANSFYASYWEEFTELRTFSLSGQMQGAAILHLFRTTADGDAVKIGEYGISDTFHVHFDIFSYLPIEDGIGRYFFDLEAVTDCTVQKIAFCAFVPPRRRVRFSLGVCTYRKEKFVTNLILSLEDYLRRGGKTLAEIIVVDNDDDGDGLKMLSEIENRVSILRVIRQGNIGGAGGFARTLYESLKSDSASHHVFMDDDVFLDADMLDRLQAFVSYSRVDHIVGGQMMDMEQPNILFEGGSKLDYWGFLNRVGEQIDAGQADEIGFFNQVQFVDYNAWWFACIPKDQARLLGLPLNIFIRGDDYEYGVRLSRANITTVSLPGVFVWHEPFASKHSAWLEYYNWRNRMIATSVHHDPDRMDIPPVNTVRDTLIGHLQNERSDILYAISRAILDFLEGPDFVLGQNAQELHESRVKAIRSISDDNDLATSLIDCGLRGFQNKLHPMLGFRQSPWLGHLERTSQALPWIDQPLTLALEAVLARYMEEGTAARELWREKALDTTKPEVWSKLYAWPER